MGKENQQEGHDVRSGTSSLSALIGRKQPALNTYF